MRPLVRLLLRLHPRDFREARGRDVEAFVRRGAREAASRGAPALVLFWVRTTLDLLGSAVRLRLRLRRRGRRDGAGDLAAEARISLRSLFRRPGYASLAVLTIVLGVSAVTTGFGLVHQVVLRPLPFPDADRLVAVRTLYGDDLIGVSDVEFLRLGELEEVFQGLAGVLEPSLSGRIVWRDGAAPDILHGARATPSFFRTLGVAPALGPGFSPSGSAADEVVLSHAFWQSRFGGDPEVVGRSLEIDGTPHAVVGVLPASFEFPLTPEPFDVWVAYHPSSAWMSADASKHIRMMARLAPGTTVEDAGDAVERTLREFRAGLPGSAAAERTVVRDVREDLLGSARQPLVLLFVGAGLVLLVAALNLAMLITARNVERRREIRIRAVLGAGRGHLIRQLLVEAGILAVVGGAVAIVLAAVILDLVFASGAGGLVRTSGAEAGIGVVLFGLGAALVPALAAAVLPALRVSTSIRDLGRRGSSTGAAGQRLTSVLAATEAALVFVLLVAAALVLRSLQEITRVDPGFDPSSAVALEIRLPDGDGPDRTLDEMAAFLRAVEERLHTVPGVIAAGTITNLPLTGDDGWSGLFVVEGREMAGDHLPVVDWELASPSYFEAAGIPLLRGRVFTPQDRSDAAPVAIIDRTLAERWWPDGDPVGDRISGFGHEGPWQTVVGVVGDVKQRGLARETRGFLYLPALQLLPAEERELVIRTSSADAAAVVPAARSVLQGLEPGLTIGEVRTLDALVRSSSGAFRLRAVLLGAFGIMALLLGMAGIYGIVAHSVHSRLRDVGIRMALGADQQRVLRRVLRDGTLPVLGGLAAGLAAVLLAGPALEGFLFGVRASDPTVLASVAGFLLLAGTAATLPSAVRARSVDPARMLREE